MSGSDIDVDFNVVHRMLCDPDTVSDAGSRELAL